MDRETLGRLVGRALVKHMEVRHHYATWNPPKPGTTEYGKWKRDHADLLHGRWADQQDHDHD